MARRRKGEKIDGWLVIDKPFDLGSTKVVSKVKWLIKAQKAGHAGTLDPLATGILPIALGEATKTVPFIMDAAKEYDFTVRWGTATDSADAAGEIIAVGGIIPKKSDIVAVLPHFTGTIMQVPPSFSAIKVDGKRAYTLARDGVDVRLKERTVDIQSLNLVSHDQTAGETTLKVVCGKGTYVRSLARDIAVRLGTYGYVSMLRRLRVGPFDLNAAISLEKLETMSHSAPACEYVLPVMTALDDILALAISRSEAADIRFGRSITVTSALRLKAIKQRPFALTHDGNLVAIADKDGLVIRPLRVFNIYKKGEDDVDYS